MTALSPAARLAAFAALLAVVGGGAAAVGSVAGPGAPQGDAMSMHAEDMSPAAQAQADGLATSAGGYTFQPERTTFRAGTTPFRFRIVDSKGDAAHDFSVEGGVRLHLIVIRRDFVGYRHVHPKLQPDGSWIVPLRFTEPGTYRAFADFERDGKKTVLGRDLFVGGEAVPQPLPPVSRAISAGAYRVELIAPALRAGKEADVSFRVTRGGVPVARFQDYVGMRGHLVALHEGDLAYSHVHPLDTTSAGRIDFRTELPSAGSYRVFLQFKVAGSVITAPFTVEVQP